MNLARFLRRNCPLALAGLYACSFLFALPGILGHLNRPASRLLRNPVAQSYAHFAIADFDGDLQPDLATIRLTRNSARAAEYFLELELSSGARPSFGILGPAGGLQITTQDVNGDKFADLVVTSALDAQFVAILLNDGKGNFRQVEASEYPEVGKRPGSRVTSPTDSASFQLALGQNRGTEGDEAASAGWSRASDNYSQVPVASHIAMRSFLTTTQPGRAPPAV